ncbi:unnamed protein product, partial [marine sediment metagenome]
MSDATSNTFYHNNIINNGFQLYRKYSSNIWDNGAGEGNYWSGYTGTDLDGDDIGDTDLPHQGVDYYPLMREGIFTPVGTDIEVHAGEGVIMHFSNVTSQGNTYVDLVEGSPPQDFRLFPTRTFYEITTTAEYSGIINISIPYDDSEINPNKE